MSKPSEVDIKIDVERVEVRVNGREVKLEPKQFVILVALEAADGRVLDRPRLLDIAFSDRPGADLRAIDQQISRLRKKLKVHVIETVTGFGFKWVGPRRKLPYDLSRLTGTPLERMSSKFAVTRQVA
jgi:DNA-binding response OmpR family regulator